MSKASTTTKERDGDSSPAAPNLFAAPNGSLALYQPVRFLGQGCLGCVVLANHRASGETVAIKFVECKSDVHRKLIDREVANHIQLNHPHVIKLREVIRADPYVGLVMEYAAGGSLFDYVTERGRLSEPEARRFMKQLLVGLDYCHKRGVVSRDIKLQNTLLAPSPEGGPPVVKLCDVGYSKHEELDSVAKSCVGMPANIAPEVIITDGPYDGKQADVWSAGVMLFAMIFGKHPFDFPEDRGMSSIERSQRMMKRIVEGHWRMPEQTAVSEAFRDLLTRVLVKDPSQRLTLTQVLAHQWFGDSSSEVVGDLLETDKVA